MTATRWRWSGMKSMPSTLDGRGKELTMSNSSPITPALLLTPQQAAEALSISQRTLWGRTKSGEFPHIKIGRCVRYAVRDLEKFIESQKKGGDAP